MIQSLNKKSSQNRPSRFSNVNYMPEINAEPQDDKKVKLLIDQNQKLIQAINQNNLRIHELENQNYQLQNNSGDSFYKQKIKELQQKIENIEIEYKKKYLDFVNNLEKRLENQKLLYDQQIQELTYHTNSQDISQPLQNQFQQNQTQFQQNQIQFQQLKQNVQQNQPQYSAQQYNNINNLQNSNNNYQINSPYISSTRQNDFKNPSYQNSIQQDNKQLDLQLINSPNQLNSFDDNYGHKNIITPKTNGFDRPQNFSIDNKFNQQFKKDYQNSDYKL